MISILNELLPYFTGLWTLPWILVGYILTNLFSKIFGEQKIDSIMKKIGLILLFVFIPSLLFRIFLDVDFESNEIIFSILCISIITFTYLITYLYAKRYGRKFYKLDKYCLKHKSPRKDNNYPKGGFNMALYISPQTLEFNSRRGYLLNLFSV